MSGSDSESLSTVDENYQDFEPSNEDEDDTEEIMLDVTHSIV